MPRKENRRVPVVLNPCSLLWCLLILVTLPATGWALPLEEDPEQSDYPPGLLATYRVGEAEIQRIDADIAFDWGAQIPDSRLPAGSFTVDWSGYFLMKAPGTYRFHAYVAGDIEVLLDDQVVLQGSAARPGWISGPEREFPFGELPLEVRYRKTGEQAVVKLCWSSPQFALEPISTHLLFREEGQPELAQIEQGRIEYRAWRCGHCHDNPADYPALPAPALSRTAGNLSADWIVNKLTGPADSRVRMPEFALNEQQARDIADFLEAVSLPSPKLASWKPGKPDDDRQAGELLVRTTGCLACHVIDELGETGLFGGGPLTGIGEKRSVEWLAHWLKNPAALNTTHRMPVFALSEKEQRQIAFYLAGLKAASVRSAAPGSNSSQGDRTSVDRGKELVTRLGCAACHEIPSITAPPVVPVTGKPLEASCLGSVPRTSSAGQPRFPHADRDALQAWLTERRQSASPESQAGSDFQRGSDLLMEKNCLACHPRDRNPGSVSLAGRIVQHDPRLSGQGQSLSPPHLTAVGDRLRDEALPKALAGEQPRRLGWLAVRMPRFQHTDVELRQLTRHLIGHDRMPGPLPDVRLQLAESTLSKSEALLLGRELTGGRAFNCIACHKMGDYEPRNTAVGTRGSDLLGMAGRLRPEYFLRWTMSPIRVVPGMEMPSFNQPRPGFAETSLDQQLATLWRALNDPTFTAPSNPTVVEQYFVVAPGESPRVVRDVFELKEAGRVDRTFLPRPLAVGLNNGHSLLFDLDQFALRGWTYGDFAFQQTEGKSWYWYLAGAALLNGWEQPSDFLFYLDGSPLPAVSNLSRRGRLLDYQASAESLQWTYRLDLDLPSGKHAVRVSETWSPLNDLPGQRNGWRRAMLVENLPGETRLSLTHRVRQTLLGEPSLRVGTQEHFLQADKQLELPFSVQNRTARLTVDYTVRLPERSTQPFPPKPEIPDRPVELTGTPGFQARRLPLSSNIMPTSIAWSQEGTLLFTSLKGDVFAVDGDDGQGLPYQLRLLAEGLSAPFGVIEEGGELLVVHKPEVISLGPVDKISRDGRRRVVADGWGHTDDYHDWVSGFARDSAGQLLIGSGSNYSQKDRPRERSRHRGEVLQLDADGSVRTIATELRYPVGIATDPQGRVFTSDQQGVQNCFNEINHIVPGRAYGVPALYQQPGEEQRAAIQIPHPWTRSVNGIFFIPEQDNLGALSAYRGHGVGCEYNNRFLVRFSLQEVNGELQGACYEFTRSVETMPPGSPLMLGPMCGGVGPDGHIYIGNIHDSGWLGGQNVGDIVRLEVAEELPNGIRELRALPEGFEIEFLRPVTGAAWTRADTYDLSGYTRVWQGAYATPDSGRYKPVIERVDVAEKGKRIRLIVNELRPAYVYDLHLKSEEPLFPASAYYTMNQVPVTRQE